MHLGGSLEYQFAAAPSMEILSDLSRVASSPPVEAMVTSSPSVEVLYHHDTLAMVLLVIAEC
jgi:hypothetical protein